MENGLIRNFNGTNNTGTGHNNSAKTWKDLTGTANGTINGATWKNDYLSFDGVNDWVNLGKINFSGHFTIDVTFSIPEEIQSGDVQIIDNLQQGGMGLHLVDGVPRVSIWLGSGYQTLSWSEKIPVDTKTRLTVTYSENETVILYVNGKKVVSKDVSRCWCL